MEQYLIGYLCLELVFFIYMFYLKNVCLPKRPVNTRARFENSVELTRDIFRLVDLLDGYTMERLISGFCLETPITEISIEQCRSLLSWCCFMREWGDLTSKEQNETLDLVKEVQERLSKEGHTLRNDPSIQPITKHVRHHLEPIMVTHRPFILYLLFWTLETLFEWLWLIPWGFQYHNINKMKYWIKKGLDHEAIVIIHGICRGWSFYWKLIQALGHRRTVVLINYTSIQVNSIPKNYFETANVVDVDEFAETVRHILNRHGLEKVTLICHSYGTFLSTWLLRIIPDRITRVCFVDPLMLTVALYETAYYLFYQEPQTVTDWIYYVFVRSNLPLANVLQRHFVWYNMVIKLDEIPKDIDVCLAYAGQEHLLDPALMHQLVKCGSNDIIYWDNIHHAECMGNDECVKDIVSWLK